MSGDVYDPTWQGDLLPGRFTRAPEKPGAVSFESFLRLSELEQNSFVDRARGGLCDRPKNFERFAEIVDARRKKERELPGGTSHWEKESYEARVRAKMVDAPGQRFERRPAERYEPDVFSPHRKSSGFRPMYPWQAT